MTKSTITLELMQMKYNAQVSQLLVDGFRSKFQYRTKVTDHDLAQFFEQMLSISSHDLDCQRIVAIQDGVVVGTLAVQWHADPTKPKQKSSLSLYKKPQNFARWNALKLWIGLILLEHQPKVGECYITDVVVHPQHRSTGISKLLFDWVEQFVASRADLNYLSLHVSSKNIRAKSLYERLSFHTSSQRKSWLHHFFFQQSTWYFMICRSKVLE